MRRGESGINCLLGLDKPVGPTSHDMVAVVRRALGERRVGHAGTLDPAASGVLVVGVGQGTRLMGLLTLDEKTYEARIAFGTQTTTDDAEGEVTATLPVPDALSDHAFATQAVAGLVGTFDQVPPAYSAISVGGRRAYDRARSGEEVELAPRKVTIREAELLRVLAGERGPLWDVRLRISKGTYVRSVARDLGRSLGTAAHLAGLRRVAAGPVTEAACLAVDELERLGPEAVCGRCLDPVATLGLPFRVLTPGERDDVACGRRVGKGLCVDPSGTIREPAQGERVSLVSAGALVGVWQRSGDFLRAEANFPAGIVGVRG